MIKELQQWAAEVQTECFALGQGHGALWESHTVYHRCIDIMIVVYTCIFYILYMHSIFVHTYYRDIYFIYNVVLMEISNKIVILN